MWKEHFKNLLGKYPKVTDKPIMKIIHNQLDIKLRQFTQEEFDIVLTKIKNRKATGLDEILPEIWKTRKFGDLLLCYGNTVYPEHNRDGQKAASSFSTQESNFGIAKNY